MGRRTPGNRQEIREKALEEVCTDPREAQKYCDKLLKNPRQYKWGHKKQAGYFPGTVGPLNGVKNPDTAHKIRMIQGLRVQGYSDKQVEESGLCGEYTTIQFFEAKYPMAFQQATDEIYTSLASEASQNILHTHAMLSRGGSIAVETLMEVCEDKEAENVHRLRAAETILRFMGLGKGQKGEGTGELMTGIAEVIRAAKDDSFTNSYIVEPGDEGIEDAEVVVGNE